MAKDKAPVTAAVRFLRQAKISYKDHLYRYEDKGGTAVSSRELGVDEHSVIKTLVMENEQKKPLIILMHGDCQVSVKELARVIGCKEINPTSPETAQKHTGYMVGGTSPFGTKIAMPIYMEESIASLEKIYINGGKRGYLVELSVQDLIRALKPIVVNVAIA